uniref:Uncharacterized protein n=1 Tax=Anguilla anguilla TaxID=7936 RepID=A0A0E9PHJ1_ANGAN
MQTGEIHEINSTFAHDGSDQKFLNSQSKAPHDLNPLYCNLKGN